MEIIPFDYHGKTIQTITKDDGSLWFFANEVCQATGFCDQNSAIRNHIRPQQKGVLDQHTPGGMQKVTIISEGGLYRLTLRAKFKKAIQFQDWVTDVVLPEIRKTGSYISPKLSRLKILEMALESEKKALALQEKVIQLEPKAQAYDMVSSSKGLVCVSDAAKILQIPPHTFHYYLSRDAYIFMRRGKWTPYALFINNGWMEVKLVHARDGSGHSYRQTFITPLGVNKLRERYNKQQEQKRLFA